MSAFLGPIHHWLYNKVQWHEELLEDILNKVEEKDFNTKILVEASNELYNRLRRVWIDSFVPEDFKFEGDTEGNHEIRRAS